MPIVMQSGLIEMLSPEARLSLSYTPKRVRPRFAQVLLLDARLSAIVRSGREELLRQMKLAWWRERLLEDPVNWPLGEPLLSAMAGWSGSRDPLVGLIDGWEALVSSERLEGDRIAQFSEGRARAIIAIANPISPHALEVARICALADLATHLSDKAERDTVAAMLGADGPKLRDLPKDYRGLAVLTTLAWRAFHDQKCGMRTRTANLLAAIRVGFLGR